MGTTTKKMGKKRKPIVRATNPIEMRILYQRYRAALNAIVEAECICGGQGPDTAYFLPGEDEKTDFGHHFGCPCVLAARALGLELRRNPSGWVEVDAAWNQ